MFKTTRNQRSQYQPQHYHQQPQNQHHHQQTQHQANYKTSICKYAKIGCKQRNTCWYAHDMDELRYRHCSNGTSCLKQDCPFVHGELPTKDVYYLRIILNSNIIGIDNNLIVKELNILANKEIKQKKIETYEKFVIELDTEDEDMDCEENDENIENILDGISKLEIGKWGDYEENTDDKMDIDYGNKECVDLELSNYIEDFTKKWNNKESREQLYDKQEETEIKKDVNMMVHVSDKEFDEILKYLNSMNIDYVKL